MELHVLGAVGFARLIRAGRAPAEEATDPARLSREITRFVMPLDATGHPMLNLPAGFDAAGRPLSMQFVAAHGREDRLVRAGHVFQTATDHHRARPRI